MCKADETQADQYCESLTWRQFWMHVQDISRQHSWSWQFETILVLAAHSDAKPGAHQTPPSNPWQKQVGSYLELLIAFVLWRKCDPHQWEGYAFCQNISKESQAIIALLYTESHCKNAGQVASRTSPVMERHWDVQICILGKSSENHLNSLFSGKLDMKLFNSEKLSNKLSHAYLQPLAQDGKIPPTVILWPPAGNCLQVWRTA